MRKLAFLCITFLSVANILQAGADDYVDFNDGGEHVIDYHVQYSPEIPDCSVRVDIGVENVPGTEVLVTNGARIDHNLWTHNKCTIVMNGGNVWGQIFLNGDAHFDFSGGNPNSGVVMNGNSTMIMSSGLIAWPHDISTGDNSQLIIRGGTLTFGVYCASECFIEGGKLQNLINRAQGYSKITGGEVAYLENSGHTDIEGGTIENINGIMEGFTRISGGTVQYIGMGHYHLAELVGDFRVKKPSSGEITETFYYGSLVNPEISDYIEDEYTYSYQGILIGSFEDGVEQEISYSIGFQSPDWTCDITLFPIIDTVTVQSPNGGETYTVGTNNTISWDSEGKVFVVELDYSTDNGSTWIPIDSVENTGSYTWTIPNTPSSECLVKISDADDPNIFDISDAPFTIQPAYSVLTYPNGGQQFYTETERMIYWNTVGSISTILIEYSTDNGTNWTPVSPPNAGNTKSYKWTVPYAISGQCLIRICDAANPSSCDVSNAPFSILASKPNLIMPNGEENLLTGSVYPIRWSTTGVIQNVAIEYSTDNGNSWQPVSPASSGNTGIYEWTVPHKVSDQCLIRVFDADHPEVSDVSEMTFQIVSSLPMLLSPNGGEKLLSGSSVPIQWNTTGIISDILIEYSLDNGAVWTEVSPPNTGNTGSYDWTVPYEMSKECLVRVSDLAHPVVSDVSDTVFEISPLYLKTPNGKEKLLINTPCMVRWESSEAFAGDLVNIKYSTDNGLNWTDLGNTENDGQYEWVLPETESNEYLVLVSFVDNPDIFGISQDTFVVYQCDEQISGDLDGDCMVGLSDFAIIAENWLNRGSVLIREYSFDESPNWTTEGQWEFGQPLGIGGDSYGYPDPNSGYTSIHVYGINLSGDYNTAVGGPYYLTTSPISCRHFNDVKVSFMSWLNIDGSDYAQCSFEVSTNGTDWVVLWSNTPDPVTDNNWNTMEFDISEYADDNPTLYLRWGYEIIDRAYPYSGWNIDDIELWGIL